LLCKAECKFRKLLAISEQHSCQAALHGCLPAEAAPALPEQCSGHLQVACFSERSENGEFNVAATAPLEANPLRYTHFARRFLRCDFRVAATRSVSKTFLNR
jgi:hypothetical protein